MKQLPPLSDLYEAELCYMRFVMSVELFTICIKPTFRALFRNSHIGSYSCHDHHTIKDRSAIRLSTSLALDKSGADLCIGRILPQIKVSVPFHTLLTQFCSLLPFV